MLQRIQTIYLLLAVILNLVTLFIPVWQFTAGDNAEFINGISVYTPEMDGGNSASFFEHPDAMKSVVHTLFLGINLLSSLFLVWLIFQFQDRKRQIKLSYIGIGMLMVEILALVLLTLRSPDFVTAAMESKPHYGFALPILAILLTFLALKGIQKDEEKVRSVDRIR